MFGGLLKFAGGLQGQLVILGVTTAVAFGGGVYTAHKFHRASAYGGLVKLVAQLGDTAQDKLDGLNKDWQAELKKASAELEAAGELRQADSRREAETLQQLEAVQDEIRKIGSKIPVLAKVGTCRLDNEFIRVWNDIARTANTGRSQTRSDDP